MKIETTTCIGLDNIQVLSFFAERFNISLSQFIVYLIMYAAKKEKVDPKAFKQIAYRKRNKDKTWRRVHLVLYHSEYEYILDIKKLWKMSLARCIEFCLENVLNEFVEYFSESLRRKSTDNYLRYYENRSYTFDFYLEKGIHCLKFYWGPPPEILNKKITLVDRQS